MKIRITKMLAAIGLATAAAGAFAQYASKPIRIPVLRDAIATAMQLS